RLVRHGGVELGAAEPAGRARRRGDLPRLRRPLALGRPARRSELAAQHSRTRRRIVGTFSPMEATWRWSVRVFAFFAMLFFAALMVVFVIVTVQHFGEKEYVTDNVSGLPPVY